MKHKIALWMRCALCGLLALLLLTGSLTPALGEASVGEAGAEAPAEAAQTAGEARQDFIDRIIALAEEKYGETRGRAQRAQYSGDIYICKNFTVYLFREHSDAFRMEAYPDVPLAIPDNMPKEDCKPYVYGIAWMDVLPEAGNPFYVAASFRYDENLSKAENKDNARAFLKQAQRGDFFQMAADYYYGVGAHSMVITGDYDGATDTIHWTDSNMKGEKRNGERYGYVQFDAEKKIDWFVDAFCRKRYGATLYRLRDDVIYNPYL